MARLFTLGNVMSNATAMIGARADLALSTASFLANQAYREVWEALPHDLQESLAISSTTSGEDKITLPSDFGEVINISNTSRVPPVLLSQVNVDTIDSDDTTLGEPETYALYSSWLELHPSPDSAYSIQLRYRAEPSVLTTTTATSSIATRFEYGWLLKTAELFCDHLNDFEQGILWRSKYGAYMAGQRNDLAKRQANREGMKINFLTRPRTASSNYSFDTADD